MPKFTVEVHEKVHCIITLEVEAKTKKKAAQAARDAWVDMAEGEKHEEVLDRWTEIDGEEVILTYNP